MISTTYLQKLLDEELNRQRTGFELIPSENYVSRDILEALGSVFTNKYAEGTPGRRYYGGNEICDKIESRAIELAKQLFSSDHANVQPLSGAPANVIVYQSWLSPGDTVLAMRLDHGGHLTHGAPVTGSAKLYNFEHYGISNVETGEIDYQKLYDQAMATKPKIILAGFSGYTRTLDYAKFQQIAEAVDAVLMADIAHIAGFIAAGIFDNPMDYGFHIMTTTTHKTLRGPRGGMILSKGVVGNPLKAPEKTVENLPTIIDREVFPGLQGGPHMNNIFAKCIAFEEALTEEFKEYANRTLINAKTLADELMNKGLKLVTNGTDNHIIQIDMLTSFGIDGREAQDTLDKIGLSANCNAIPFDTLPPFKPSGLRLGTPAITTRGLSPDQMRIIADFIYQAITNRGDEDQLKQLRLQVAELAKQYPLPSDK